MESQPMDLTYAEAKAVASKARSERLRSHAVLRYLFTEAGTLSGVACSCSNREMNLTAWKVHMEKEFRGT